MTDQTTMTLPDLPVHGGARLPAVEVDSYNLEIKDDEGFLGDRATKGAFREILENWRKPLRKNGERSVRRGSQRRASAKKRSTACWPKASRKPPAWCKARSRSSPRSLRWSSAAYLKLKAWRDTERIVIGGGFRASRVGELAIGRAGVILKAEDIDVSTGADPQRSR